MSTWSKYSCVSATRPSFTLMIWQARPDSRRLVAGRSPVGAFKVALWVPSKVNSWTTVSPAMVSLRMLRRESGNAFSQAIAYAVA